MSIDPTIRLAAIDAKFAALEEASRSLSADVQTLNSHLEVVNKLQTEQREISRRNEETQRHLNKVETEAVERSKRTQRVLRWVGWGMAVLIPLVSILVYWSTIAHVNDLLSQSRAERLRGCEIRNEATRAHQRREDALAAAESDPLKKRIHEESARELTRLTVDCAAVVR